MLDLTDQKGLLFEPELQAEIKEKFLHVDTDPFTGNRRLFFDNAGGAFRLKKVIEEVAKVDSIPDCPERFHKMADYLQEVQKNGEDDIRIIFNAKKGGSIATMLNASQAFFTMLGAVAENIPGTNIVTTALEHPSAYDAACYYAQKTKKELRTVKTNPATGGVDVADVVSQIDSNTCLLSFMYASNLSGAIFDAKAIIKAAREIKPNLFILIDAVQHAPHAVMDFDDLDVDGMNFGPYKFFAARGFGVAYLSERLANLPHHRLLASSQANWELGSPAPAQYASITEVVNYVCWLGGKFSQSKDRRELFAEGMNRIAMHERALLHRLLNGSEKILGLRKMKGVRSYLDNPDLTKRDLIVAMGIDGLGFNEAVKEYDKRGVTIFERVNTSLYSKRMLESFDIEGCLRISPIHVHGTNDIDDFLAITQELAGQV